MASDLKSKEGAARRVMALNPRKRAWAGGRDSHVVPSSFQLMSQLRSNPSDVDMRLFEAHMKATASILIISTPAFERKRSSLAIARKTAGLE